MHHYMAVMKFIILILLPLVIVTTILISGCDEQEIATSDPVFEWFYYKGDDPVFEEYQALRINT